MRYEPTAEDIRLLKQKTKTLYCKIYLLDKDMSVLDSLEGLTISGSITIDADSDIRRTFNSTIYLSKRAAISKYAPEDWVNKYIRVYLGLKGPGRAVVWYNQGVFAFNQNGFTYSESEHTLAVSCVDLVAELDGTLGGKLIGYATQIPAGSSIQQAIVQTFQQSEFNDCRVAYWNREVPYDLEFGAGTTVWEILKELRDLYYPFEMYFDDDVFVCGEIPNGDELPIAIDHKLFGDMVVSESASVDYSEIKNCVEVFGAVLDSDGVCTLTTPEVNNVLGRLQYAYGNIDNFTRKKIVWSNGNLEKYRDVISDWGWDVRLGSYSTVEAATYSMSETEVAYTPLLQLPNEDELIPLSRDTIRDYLDDIARNAYNDDYAINAQALLAADKVGSYVRIGGEFVKVRNMILAVEGQTVNGESLTAADVGAIAGMSASQIQSKYGATSKYTGYGVNAIYQMLGSAVQAANNGNLTLYLDQIDLAEKDRLAFCFPVFERIASHSFTISVVNSLASETKRYDNVPLYQYTGNNSDPDVPYDTANIRSGEYYVIRYVRNHRKFQFLGQQMTHAMVKLVDKMPSPEEIERQKEEDNCGNMKFVVLTEQGEDSFYNPRFSIERIGRRNEVLSGGEYDHYMTDAAVMGVAEYEHWKSCRLTDSIDVTCVLIPWLDVNQKISYAPRYLNTNRPLEYMIKKINIELGSGTMNLTLSRFFPYYPFIVEDKY